MIDLSVHFCLLQVLIDKRLIINKNIDGFVCVTKPEFPLVITLHSLLPLRGLKKEGSSKNNKSKNMSVSRDTDDVERKIVEKMGREKEWYQL